MPDIKDRKDIIRLVDTFYSKVRVDDLLKPVFEHVNWPEHLPTMYNFWASMLLGDQSYTGSPYEKHARLSVGSTHFDRWLELFYQTVNELFEGPASDEVKDRARSIAGIFQHKMGLMGEK